MDTLNTAYFLEQLMNKHLYTLPTSWKTYQYSSLNQKMGPRDCNYFLRQEEEGDLQWNVLTEHHGPGVLSRLWLTGDAFDGPFEIYVDDETHPIISTTVNELFGGQYFPFIKPLVLDYEDSSRARVSYFPIVFKKYLKIRSADSNTSFYWHANITSLNEDDSITSFSRNLDSNTLNILEQVCSVWKYKNALGDNHLQQPRDLNLAPNKDTVLYSKDHKGVITEFMFDMKHIPYKLLGQLELRIYWDGEFQPSVTVPLHHFFVQGSKSKDFQSFYIGKEDNLYICKIPMPFNSAKIILVNNSEESLPLIYCIKDNPMLTASTQRFHCHFQEANFKYGTTFKCLELEGKGRFLGMNLITKEIGIQTTPANFTQEGNEYIYTDGEQDPSWLGTGTEDYFNCAYYYKYGELSTVTHGCMKLHTSEACYTPGYGPATLVSNNRGLVSAYRFHLLDAITFNKQLIFILEAGCPKKGALADVNGKEELLYQWTCYWYQEKSNGTLNEKDLTV